MKYKNTINDLLKSINKQIYFYKKQYSIEDFICEKIVENTDKSKLLNFFVWSGFPSNDGTRHNSIIMNYRDSYYFLDSTSTREKRFPSDETIGNNSEENSFIIGKTFAMQSFLQRDSFNCSSFSFEFIKNLTTKFEEFNKNIDSFDEYLKIFFCEKAFINNEETK